MNTNDENYNVITIEIYLLSNDIDDYDLYGEKTVEPNNQYQGELLMK